MKMRGFQALRREIHPRNNHKLDQPMTVATHLPRSGLSFVPRRYGSCANVMVSRQGHIATSAVVPEAPPNQAADREAFTRCTALA